MNIEKFREVIQERIQCHNEWAYGIEQCWKKEIDLLAEDVSSTMDFLINECTADEYSWISEVIDDVAAITQSRELIECYKSLIDKFPEECKTYDIAGSIECAEAALRGVSDCGKES